MKMVIICWVKKKKEKQVTKLLKWEITYIQPFMLNVLFLFQSIYGI